MSTVSAGGVSDLTRRTARNAAALVAGELLGKVATFAWTVVAARLLAPAAYGAFLYALATALLLSPLADWGTGKALVLRGSAAPERAGPLLASVLAFTLGVGVVLYAAAAAAIAPTRPSAEAVAVLVTVFGATLLDLAGDAARSAASALQRQAGVAVALVAQRSATGLLVVAALSAGVGVRGVALGYLVGSAVGNVAVLVLVARAGARPRLRDVSAAGVREVLAGGWLIGVNALVAMALFRVDALLLAALVGDTAVAEYGVAYRLVETVLFWSWSISHAVLPVMSATPDIARVRRGLEQAVAVACVVYVPFAVVCLTAASQVLDLLYGPGYAATSATALRLLAPAPLLFGAAFLTGSALVARGRPGRVLLATATALAVNVAGNAVLIPRFGPAGAAAMTSAATAVQLVVVLAGARAVLGLPRLDRAMATSLAAAVPLAVVALVVPGPVLAVLAMGGAAYAGTWLALARWTAPDQVAALGALLPGVRSSSRRR